MVYNLSMLFEINIFLFLIFLLSEVKLYHIDSLQSLLDVKKKSVTSPLKELALIASKQEV